MINFLFTVSFFLPTYGGHSVTVIAPNVVEALRLAAGTEHGWMLTSPMVSLSGVERGMSATCEHFCGTARDAEGTIFECDDCPETWLDGEHPAPSATAQGFRAYCDGLVESGAAFR